MNCVNSELVFFNLVNFKEHVKGIIIIEPNFAPKLVNKQF